MRITMQSENIRNVEAAATLDPILGRKGSLLSVNTACNYSFLY
jgi:hypothetical protein